jgi:hypothetical protein
MCDYYFLYFGLMCYRKEEILGNSRRNKSHEIAKVYFDSMASYVDELRKLQGALRVKIRDYVNSNLLDASHKEAYGIAILVLVLVVSPVIIILVHNAVATIQVWHSQSLRTLQLELHIQHISKSVTSGSSMTLSRITTFCKCQYYNHYKKR